MSLNISKVFTYDTDAGNYIQAVEGPTGDNQALEPAVRQAINNFVVGCKQDGIWDAIKASCILAGARTLDGALVPLVGTAPDNYNFVDANYDRKTGLVGDGSTKYLDSNRSNNADPQDNFHTSTYASDVGTSGNIISTGGASSGATRVIFSGTSCRDNALSAWVISAGLLGVSRSDASSYDRILASTVTSIAQGSSTPLDANLSIFTGNFFSDARLAFYSIGEALDLQKLDSRVTDLITAFGAAIP